MIHNDAYNSTFTHEMNAALTSRNIEYLASEIQRLSKNISERQELSDLCSIHYDEEMSKLQFCLALLDSLQRHSETTKLICDVVNF